MELKSINFDISDYGMIKEEHKTVSPQKSHHMPRPLDGILKRIIRKMKHGHLTIYMPNGDVITNKTRFEHAIPPAELFIHNMGCIKKLLRGGILGFCESYMDGDWSTPNLATLLTVGLMNEKKLAKLYLGQGLFRFISGILHRLNKNTKTKAQKNISKHYDLGNTFYSLWLDPSMTYSSALFRHDYNASLEDAQEKKYAALCQKMGIKNGEHILEIGCGWGGFAEYTAKNFDVKITCLTISKEQHAYATERLKKAGLDDRVEIRFQDYRDIEGQFDHIASIEMFEAVGEEYWETFFAKIRQCLKPKGSAALQIITIGDEYFESYKRTGDFIQRYIFPGGMLPSKSILNSVVKKAGMTVEEWDSFGEDYAQTLMLWNKTFQGKWQQITPLGFDKRFKRMWELYFAYCTAGFLADNIDVVQIKLGHTS